MDCPTCNQTLTRTTYEQTRVLQCEQCSGYLVARKWLRLIRLTRELSPDDLATEAKDEQQADTKEEILCPKCRDRHMKKERVRVSESELFMLDVCPKCDHVWLDGGELARLQMKFEQSAKAVEAFARQEKLQNLSDGRREALEKKIDELPRRENPITAGAMKGTVIGVLVAVLIAVVVGIIWWLSR